MTSGKLNGMLIHIPAQPHTEVDLMSRTTFAEKLERVSWLTTYLGPKEQRPTNANNRITK